MNTGKLAGLASAAVVAVIGGTFLFSQIRAPADRFAACTPGNVAGGAIGGPFELVDHTGATVTDADVITAPTLVYFGYTFCPDYCPNDLARTAIATDILNEQGHKVTPAFVTIDPSRDTVSEMSDYVQSYHPAMIGLTGSEEQVSAAARAYKVYFKRADSDPDYYLMDHSTLTYLMLPDHGFADFFRSDESPESMANRVACFIDAA